MPKENCLRPPRQSVLLVKPADRPTTDLPEDPSSRAGFPPLELATVAALTTHDIDVDIWDERVSGRILESTQFRKDYAVVGVTGYLSDRERVKELGDLFRRRGMLAVAGGVGVSTAPEVYRGHFDVLFLGEAEYTWPRFLSDLKSGCPRTEYRQVTKVDLADSPVPRWDLVPGGMKHYAMGSVQTTRGCPFDCEFCDVVHLFGRRPRQKPVAQVVEEVRALEPQGFRRIFFSDDNFYGDPRHAKALLRELISLNRSFPRPMAFGTQISLNIADDEEFLALAAEANLNLLFIGIETANKESLKEINKLQNYRLDLVEAVKKIQSYGLSVLGSMMVGFDHDGASIFQQQFELIQNACLPGVNIRVLSAVPGTRLWVRLLKEGRVLEEFRLKDATGYITRWAVTNAIPKNMSLTELLAGYRDLVKKVFDWDHYEARLKGMLSLVQHRPARRPRQAMPRSLGKVPATLKAAAAGLWYLASHKSARQALLSFLGDRRARHAIRQCLPLAIRHGGFLVRSTLFQIWIQHLAARHAVPKMIEEIDEEIRRIGDPDKLPREKTVLAVPDAFREPYQDVFPQVYERVRQGLADGARIEVALVEVIHDFLARWGATFERFEEFHRQSLLEACDRTIDKENRSVPSQEAASPGKPPLRRAAAPKDDLPRMRAIADAVLQCVEEEFRSLRRLPLVA